MIRWLLDRFTMRKPDAVRRFEGAGPGRRFAGLLPFGNATTATLAANPTLRGRQRTQASNNVWLSNGVAAMKAAAVGTGIKPQSIHPDPATRAKLQAMWTRWIDRADIEGRSDRSPVGHHDRRRRKLRPLRDGRARPALAAHSSRAGG